MYSDVYEWPTAEAALAGVLQRGGDIVAEHVARCASDAAYVESIINFFASAHDADAAPPHVHVVGAGNGHAAPSTEAGGAPFTAAPRAAPAAAADDHPRRASPPPLERAGGSDSTAAAPQQLEASCPRPHSAAFLRGMAILRVEAGLERLDDAMDWVHAKMVAPRVRVNWLLAHARAGSGGWQRGRY